MIQETSSAIIALLLAKFMLNDIPHAAGLIESEGSTMHTPHMPGLRTGLRTELQNAGFPDPHGFYYKTSMKGYAQEIANLIIEHIFYGRQISISSPNNRMLALLRDREQAHKALEYIRELKLLMHTDVFKVND